MWLGFCPPPASSAVGGFLHAPTPFLGVFFGVATPPWFGIPPPVTSLPAGDPLALFFFPSPCAGVAGWGPQPPPSLLGGGASPNPQHPKLLQVSGSPPKIFILRGGTSGKSIHSAESFEEGSGEPPPRPLHPRPHRSAREGGRRGGVPAVPPHPPKQKFGWDLGSPLWVCLLGLPPGHVRLAGIASAPRVWARFHPFLGGGTAVMEPPRHTQLHHRGSAGWKPSNPKKGSSSCKGEQGWWPPTLPGGPRPR